MLVDVIENEDGSATVSLPYAVRKALNIGEGSEVTLNEKDGAIVMTRTKPLKTFAVETISMFRHIYFVKAECAEHAMDEVTMNTSGDMPYFQTHVTESILSSHEVDVPEQVRLIRETEQPNLTEQEFKSKNWETNTTTEVKYYE